MYIDSHSHVASKELHERAEEIFDSMKANEMAVILDVGYNVKNSERSVALAEKYDSKVERVLAAVGVHPSDCAKWDGDSYERLKKLAKSKKVVAVGEIGLDYHYDGYDATRQKEIFVKQIELAHELKLPIIFHLRDATKDMQEILAKRLHLLDNGVLFHCYNGGDEFFEWANKNIKKCYFGFGGSTTYKKSTCLQTAKNCPATQILLETDCPYLTPMPLRGKCINEPKFVKFVYEFVANLRGVEVEQLAKQVEKNFWTLFGGGHE